MTKPDSCAIFVDAGTTNTRVWLVAEQRTVAKANQAVGIRDCARDGNTERLKAALRRMIAELVEAHGAQGRPRCIVAAGMITSELGLAAVPHIDAPAGLEEIRAGMQRHQFADISELPFYLVPGVRCGRVTGNGTDVSECDFMRGEETLCLGLLKLGTLRPRDLLLSIGSHWKLIELDSTGKIRGSRSTLSGELLHAVQTNTILASSLPAEFPAKVDAAWVRAGRAEQKRSGMSRALYCVRLLEQRSQTTAGQRFAFTTGAVCGGDIGPLLATGLLTNRSMLITGRGAVAYAWQALLSDESISSRVLDSNDVEAGLIAGMVALMPEEIGALQGPCK